MTFKHTKFSESEIMRSFEKVAINKGLVKPDHIKKQASVQLDLTASDNLMQDVIKLCAGLRSRGFDKYAEELESNLIEYKKASSLYQTSKETGEDLIDMAHPKGSHKIPGVAGDATVETILDRHLKMLEVVNKKPTGKLAIKNILNAVKIALAGEEEAPKNLEEAERLIIDAMTAAKECFHRIESYNSSFSKDVTFNIFKKSGNLPKEDILRMISLSEDIIKSMPDTYSFLGEDGKTIITNYFKLMIDNYRLSLHWKGYYDAYLKSKKDNEIEANFSKSKNEINNPLSESFNKLISTYNKLNEFKNNTNIQKSRSKNRMLEWIDNELKILNVINSKYGTMNLEQKLLNVQNMKKEVDEEVAIIDDFEQKINK